MLVCWICWIKVGWPAHTRRAASHRSQFGFFTIVCEGQAQTTTAWTLKNILGIPGHNTQCTHYGQLSFELHIQTPTAPKSCSSQPIVAMPSGHHCSLRIQTPGTRLVAYITAAAGGRNGRSSKHSRQLRHQHSNTAQNTSTHSNSPPPLPALRRPSSYNPKNKAMCVSYTHQV